MNEGQTYIVSVAKGGESLVIEYTIITYMKNDKQIIDVEIKKLFRNGVEIPAGNTLREQFTL